METKEHLFQLKQQRDHQAVESTLSALRNAAKSDDNLMPYILDAVRVYATLGEIANVLREEFGEYKPV